MLKTLDSYTFKTALKSPLPWREGMKGRGQIGKISNIFG
jgi:hypothetical protein